MTEQKQLIQQPIHKSIQNNWHLALHKLFEHPAIVCIGGIWKVGKTDFALYIAETLLKLHSTLPGNEGMTVISAVASNIETFGTFPLISDLISLRQWLYESNRRKLYIFDEANLHLPSRRSMSGKNVEIMKLFAEISKAHARMIFIGQNLARMDKELLDPVWVRGIFIKKKLKTAQCISHLLPQTFIFNNIPKCATPFDPYAVAPFTERPSGKSAFKDSEHQLLWDWCHGGSYRVLGVHPMQLNRIVRRFVKQQMENLHEIERPKFTIPSDIHENVKIEQA